MVILPCIAYQATNDSGPNTRGVLFAVSYTYSRARLPYVCLHDRVRGSVFLSRSCIYGTSDTTWCHYLISNNDNNIIIMRLLYSAFHRSTKKLDHIYIIITATCRILMQDRERAGPNSSSSPFILTPG